MTARLTEEQLGAMPFKDAMSLLYAEMELRCDILGRRLGSGEVTIGERPHLAKRLKETQVQLGAITVVLTLAADMCGN